MASSGGFQMFGVAVGWQIYSITHNPFDLGLIGLVQFVPLALLVLPAGHIADRYDRRFIAGGFQLLEGVAAGVLTVATFQGWVNSGVIYAVVLLLGVGRAFEAPTLQAMAPGLVPREIIGAAVARASSASQTAVVIGPAIGGFLYAFNPSAVYLIVSILYVASSICVGSIRMEAAIAKKEPFTMASLFAGIRFIGERPMILGAISLDLFAVLLGGATALLPVFARDILNVGPVGLGILRSAPAFGALAMSLLLGSHPLPGRVGRTLLATVAAFGVGTIVFGISHSFALSFIALVSLGLTDMLSVVIRRSLVQVQTPDTMRGRVNAVSSLFTGTSNQLGAFESGVTAAWFGTVPAVLIGGIGTIAIALLWMKLFPDLARARTLEG